MRRGFTLVELSIVLIIIGLLIGGILVAQSMIKTVKIQSVIRELQQINVAVDNFKTKYQSVPGDSTFFTNPGNGDGLIRDVNGWPDNSHAGSFYSGELANFWPHLQQSGFAITNQTLVSTPLSFGQLLYNSGPTTNLPAVSAFKDQTLSAGGKLSYYPYVCLNPPTASCGSSDFSLEIASLFFVPGPPDLAAPIAGITPLTAYSLDVKIDDGIPTSGNVISGPITVCYSGTTYFTTDNFPAGGCITGVKIPSLSAN